MIQPLNYVPKAVADLMDMPNLSARDRGGLRFIIELLRKAEIFTLPDGAHLLDRSSHRPQVPLTMFRPPFPVIAIEYPATGSDWSDPLYSTTTSSRRIALAWDWSGKGPSGALAPGFEGVAIAPICFHDQLQRWAPPYAIPLLAYDGQYTQPTERNADADFRRRSVEVGRITRKQASAPQLQVAELLTVLPDGFAAGVAQYGLDQMFNFASADYMDECNAYFDLCLALACSNVSTERHLAPAALNKRRIRAGKPPLRDFHILKIAGHGDGEGGGIGSAGFRSHLRRGHIRRLGPERITWVNSCMVRGSVAGFIDKQYALEGPK